MFAYNVCTCTYEGTVVTVLVYSILNFSSFPTCIFSLSPPPLSPSLSLSLYVGTCSFITYIFCGHKISQFLQILHSKGDNFLNIKK